MQKGARLESAAPSHRSADTLRVLARIGICFVAEFIWPDMPAGRAQSFAYNVRFSYRLPAWLIVHPPTHSGQERDGHTPLTPLTTFGAMEQTADSDGSTAPRYGSTIASFCQAKECRRNVAYAINNWLHMRSSVQHSAARSMMRQHDG